MGIDTLRVKTVLIVDKTQSVLDSSREFLETADFCVITANSGWEAIKLAMLFLWVKVNGQWMCQGDFFIEGSFATGKVTSQ